MGIMIGTHGFVAFMIEILIYLTITIILEYLWELSKNARARFMDWLTNKFGPTFIKAIKRMRSVVKYGIIRLYNRRENAY